VAGRCFVSGRGDDFIVLKLLTADGEIDWHDTAGGLDGLDDRAWDIVVGPDDHPVLTGVVVNAETSDFWTIKYDQNGGGIIWDVLLAGAINNATRAGWLAVMDNGDIILANRTWSGTTNYDVVLYRLAAADGDIVWAKQYGSGGTVADDPRAMIPDAAGNPIVVGVSASDYMIVKFSAASGDTLWTAAYDGPPGWYDVATCATIGPVGEVIVSGFSDGTGTGWDVATVGLAPETGVRLWVLRHDGNNQTDEARNLVVNAQGDIYVTGYSYHPLTNMDMLAIRYETAVAADTPDPAGQVLRLAAHPNPFNPRVTFTFTLPVAGWTQLALYDLQGRHVQTVFEGHLVAGDHAMNWNGRNQAGRAVPAGVYLARIEGAGQGATRKVVLAR
jgi:hypothetical protein